MTWSYNATLAGDGATNTVRMLIGDTVSADPLLQDEEIAAQIARFPCVEYAASAAAGSIYAKFARLADVTDGDVSVKYSQKAAQYSALAVRLAGEAVTGAAPAPFVGGTSIAENEAARCDPDRPADSFYVGLHDYP
jgi:hypothetical protein